MLSAFPNVMVSAPLVMRDDGSDETGKAAR
jgi:hypothetical protein